MRDSGIEELFTAYRAKRPEPACPEFIEWVEGLTAHPLFSLPLSRFLLSLGGSIFSWQTLIGHCTPLEGIGPNGFSDRRILSFDLAVCFLPRGFPTQTEQPRCSGARGSSLNRNCTVFHAKPST